MPNRLFARCFIATGLCLAAMALPARADLVTFAFSGHVGAAALGLAAGTPISGRYTFDGSATDALGSDPTQGLYFSTAPDTGWIVDIGGQLLTTQPTGGSRVGIRVFDNSSAIGSAADGYAASGFGLAGALGSFVINLGNLNERLSLFGSDALPTAPPGLAAMVGQLLAPDGLTPLLSFTLDSLTLSDQPFPGSIPPPVGGGGGGSGGGGGGGGGTGLPTLDPAACAGVSAFEARLLCLVNDIRTRAGLAPLTADDALERAAQAHVADMHLNAFFGHDGSDGSSFIERMAAAAYDGNAVSELLGIGFARAEDLLQAWLDDAAHRDQLLSARADEAGIELLVDGGTRLWALLLGDGRDANAVPLPGTLALVLAAAAAWAARRPKRQPTGCPLASNRPSNSTLLR